MNNTKAIVMSRVRAIHAMRPFVSTSALCVVLVLASVYAISREVWVAMVLKNMPSPANVLAFSRFFLSAFEHTHLVVQAFVVLAIVSAAWLVADSVRSLSLSLSPVRA